MTSRSENFQNRINTEREVICIVNRSDFGKHTPLAGLSIGAINNWLLRLNNVYPTKHADTLYAHLVEIGKSIGSISDDSRGIFQKSKIQNLEMLEKIKFNIKELCKKILIP
ncbi:MAG: hypothetical protein RIE06_32405 [Roseibium album]|uniref:hypothetical protein n=1 Tax=Roseibium album TaxID=311410 RepID=UPI0032ED28DE